MVRIRFPQAASHTNPGIAADLLMNGVAEPSSPTRRSMPSSTPHSQHGPQVERAAASGKPVFMEKPFTLDVASAERALDAVARAGIVLVNWRF
jgi:hypothetical protein